MFLGLDLGTSSLKALLVDGDQRAVGAASAPMTVQRPAPGYSEQDPEDWWRALEGVMAALREPYLLELPSLYLITRSKLSREISTNYHKPQDPPKAFNKNGPLRLHFQHLDRLSAPSTA